MICPACGHENRAEARFCDACGAALATQPAPTREERKIVTVLFCDLVGSTARAEGADPEDVRALLSAYHERVRSELERFGGTVEKFIGDAVMALFGAPTAHEDDPERAVRAALAIRDWAQEDGDLQVRIGITTGEVLVALGADPQAGEGMASGDVVNTAARMQSAAPVDGILTDETTHRATSNAIDFREHAPVEAKGKAEPVRVWEALRVQLTPIEERASLVGREEELRSLRDALERVRRDRSPQLVTLVGVPGIGKSRLVQELRISAADSVTWRQGRSLSYGEGVSFWAFGEIVKEQAGILDTDPPEVAEGKLRSAVAGAVADERDAEWVEPHLAPLVGLGGDGAAGEERRAESFAAWRQFVEALAGAQPLVLVFEDLHWADDGLLGFVESLLEWLTDVPLLLVGTARPELLERRPTWGAAAENAAVISLAPLDDEQTAALIGKLLERPLLPAEQQAALLEQAGGNPLYAEQYVRMLRERGETGEVPETVQGLITARLDALPEAEKALLQSASVVGKGFWAGAVAAVAARDRWSAEEQLRALERKEFLRRSPTSSVAGETEYAFAHALIRDVAYGQIPRAQRAEKHRLAAEWIESLGRPEDHAEMLAHHYLSALELARAAGEDASPLAEPARRALGEAGERALALNAYAAAAGFYSRALELCLADDPSRPYLLLRYGTALFHSEQAGADVLAEASEALLAAGDVVGAAEAESVLGAVFWYAGSGDEAAAHLRRASDLVEGVSPSRAKAQVLAAVGGYLTLAGVLADSIRANRAALAVAEELGLEDVRAEVLHHLGYARTMHDDLGGIADLEQSVALAEAGASPVFAARALGDLSWVLFQWGDVRRAVELWDEYQRQTERVGNIEAVRDAKGGASWIRFVQGRWDEALEVAEAFIGEVEAGSPHRMEWLARFSRSAIRVARGNDAGALEDLDGAVELAHAIGSPEVLLEALCYAPVIYCALGRDEAASLAMDEWLAACRQPGVSRLWLPEKAAYIAPPANRLGRADEVAAVLSNCERTPWLETAEAHLRGEHVRAASLLGSIGDGVEEAAARLRAADQLLAEGRRQEAGEQLQQALAFYRSVGASRYIQEGEALLAKTA